MGYGCTQSNEQVDAENNKTLARDVVHDCGYPGMSPSECQHSGCVWQPGSRSWCQFDPRQLASNEPSVAPAPNGMRWFLSVIIICYQQERFLVGAMNSARAATRRLPPETSEVLVVDDCSTCLTPRVRALASVLSIRVHRNPRNLGLAASRNFAASTLAAGDYVLFLDADDQLHPHWLARAQPHVGWFDFIYGNQIMISSHVRHEWRTSARVSVADAAKGQFGARQARISE